MTDLGPFLGWLIILTFVTACTIASHRGIWHRAITRVQDAMTGRVHDTWEDEPA